MRSHLTFLTEGSETAIFRSYFDVWPQFAELRLYEEGRGKVAGLITIATTFVIFLFFHCSISRIYFNAFCFFELILYSYSISFLAMFKQQGLDVKEFPEEDCDLFIDCSGTLKVTS